MDLKFKDNNKLSFALFTQLEYIESTGTQYIDTGIKPVANDEFEVTYMITGTTGTYNSVFGTRVSFSSNAFMFGYKSGDSYIEFGNQNINSFNKGYSQNIKHTIKLENGNLYVDDVFDRSIVINQNTVHNLLLFTLNDNGGPGEFGKCKIYNFIIKRAGVKVLELIPASNYNGLCFYDTVSKTFFYNQGTGNFIAGPEVPSIIGLLPSDILLKTTSLYHKNTPNVDGLQLLNGILYVQETAEDVVLNRIRVDIGNVSGPISQLLQYAGMAGFNDNYEPQTKPRLVGTWTINNWYTTSQLSQARSAFDGLTIVEDPNYVIDFSEMAVQVLDPNEDNYNPAVAIALNSQNRGTTTIGAPCGYGRWFLTKTDAAAITDIATNGSGGWTSWFSNLTTINDSNSIVDGESHTFTSFNELKYFTNVILRDSGYTNACLFYGCNYLEEVTIPSHINYIPMYAFMDCSRLTKVNLDNIITIDKGCFSGCNNIPLTNTDINKLTSIGGKAFKGCSKATFTTINANVTNIDESITLMSTFANTTSIPYLHFLSETPVTGLLGSYERNHIYNPFYGTTYKIYVGDGSSELHDQEILVAYKRASNWSGMVRYLDSWYDFAIPHLSYDGEHVTITVQRESTIYYTTDGTTPTTESMEYMGPFSWNGQGVIKTMATNSYNDTVYAPDFYSTTVYNPEITINTTTKQITLSSTTPNTTIHYTLNGTYPTLDSPTYSGPIDATNLGDTVKVRCFAIKSEMNDSEVIGKICVMDDSLWGTDSDTSSFAVQCMDSTKPNYNPAVCIILDNNNRLTNKCFGVGGYISKTDAAAITSIGTWFCRKTSVTDNSGVVSNETTRNYNFESFDEFRFFGTTFIAYEAFNNCTMLDSIILPTTVQSIDDHANGGNNFVNTKIESINIEDTQATSIPQSCFNGCSKLKSISSTKITSVAFNSFANCQNLEYCNFPNLVSIGGNAFANCSSLKTINFSNNLTKIGNGSIGSSFMGCVNLELDHLPSTLTILSGGTFYNCLKITISELPVGVTTLYSTAVYNNTFCNCQSIPYLHILYQGVLTRNDGIWGNFKIYVGDGSSSSHDDAILADYLANSAWASYSTRLDTWYNYLHPTT